MYQPLSQLGRVVRPVPAMPVHAEIQEASQLPSSDDAIGQFALNRDALEIGGDFLENKWDVGAVDGNLHNDRTGLIVEEGQTMPLAHRLAFLILDHVRCGRNLQVTDAKHGRFPRRSFAC